VLSAGRLSALCALLVAAAISVAFTCSSLAQSGSGSEDSRRARRAGEVPQPTPTPPKKDDDITLSSDEVVRVDASLTNVFFTAADKQKRFISNLKREDVRVLEDGVAQDIFTFQQSVELPLSLAILIDCSGSEERTLPGYRSSRICAAVRLHWRRSCRRWHAADLRDATDSGRIDGDLGCNLGHVE
jgi:hypothetical protein